MTDTLTCAASVTLDNCDREPIHIPGSIQPTGALLAFDRMGTVVAWSTNVAALIGIDPIVGAAIADLPFDQPSRELLRECLRQTKDEDVPYVAIETAVDDRQFDLIVHAYNGRVIAEFELRSLDTDESAAFAFKANRAINRIKRYRALDDLLTNAVEDIRALTGFDRVMAYRFRHDDSGDIVAESRRADLQSYLGRRYPASDIPAQARRLYTINTLRLISDVSYSPVPLTGWMDSPLDLSHSVLRSVSPIHIEYLQNMGVGASMSISIIVEGRLWGMIACHHMSARRVPFSVRMTCDVLAQVIAANVQAIEGRDTTHRIQAATAVRGLLLESLLHEEDVLRAIAKHAAPLLESLGGEALIATQFGRLITHGELSPMLAKQIVQSLEAPTAALEERTQRADWDAQLQETIGPWVGLLALRFDPATAGMLLVLRREQIETVRWGGNPDKEIRVGPLGPRLTPRGSFAEWHEVVRGRSEPWGEDYRAIARQLFGEMQRISNARLAETERARAHLLAMLGHDLRDPLHSISMAATAMGRVAPQQQLTQRIKASSNRMQRLIDMVLDVSRIGSGLGLGLSLGDSDVRRVINDVVEEARVANPTTVYVIQGPDSIAARVDVDRVGQLISNLLSNARHHGKADRPILIAAHPRDGRVIIEVSNEAEPIERMVEATLFSAYKPGARRNDRNPTGLGLGLHIAHAIATGHGGTLTYRYAAPHVVFAAELAARDRSSNESP